MRRGVMMLNDTRTRLGVRGESLELAGVRFWTRKPADIARVLRGAAGTTLLLAHDPRRLTEAAALGVPAVLSGHTHGGQVVLPGLDIANRRRFPVLQGLGAKNDTSIFVSRGVGTVYVPVRINCPPEVAILTLTRPQRLSRHGDLPRAIRLTEPA
jgi:predicted MPP superfamily phosphohydrolase